MDLRTVGRLVAAGVTLALLAAGCSGGEGGAGGGPPSAPAPSGDRPEGADRPSAAAVLPDGSPWTPFEAPSGEPDVGTERLCDTAGFDEPTVYQRGLPCRFDGGRFAEPTPPRDRLVVMTWNMERNYELEDQVAEFRRAAERAAAGDPDPELPFPDVLLAGEVDRGCDRSDGVDGAREFARALGYDYVFGVEFQEGVRDDLSSPCEHGQAVFSRYPIGNVELFRHPNIGYDRPDSVDEPRIGTRADLQADIRVGDRFLRVVSVHYDDAPQEEEGRVMQAAATADNGNRSPIPVVVGGDMNTILYFADPTPASTRSDAARQLWDRGWVDTHAGLDGRITVPFDLDGVEIPAVVDLLWVRAADRDRASDPGGCPPARCRELSDHLPQWVTVSLG